MNSFDVITPNLFSNFTSVTCLPLKTTTSKQQLLTLLPFGLYHHRVDDLEGIR